MMACAGGVEVGVPVGVAEGVAVAVVVGVGVGDGVGVPAVGVAVGVGVGVVGDGVGVGVSHGMGKRISILSTRQPVPEPLQSVARRKRRTTFCCHAADGSMAAAPV